ncbi:MAG: PKD domain-containing protein, partial [Methanolinea sp.]|nr:PKD domain-containing protein [Methanolinea sp.]
MQVSGTEWKKIQFCLFITLLAVGILAGPGTGAGNLTDEVWTLTSLTPETADSIQDYPAVWEDRVVWADWRSGNADIYLYNITSGGEIRVTRNETDAVSPDLFGDRIVWVDYRDQNADIWMYDLSSDTEFKVTDDPADQVKPRIWGDRIVWVDFRGSNAQIYLYDIISGEERPISGEDGYAEDPAIWQDYVTWGEFREDDYDIIAYDLPTGTEETVASDDGDQKFPSIYKDTIVFVDYQDIYPRLMEWNLTTHMGRNLTNNPWYDENPVVYGDYVVFENQSINSDLSLLDRIQGIEVLLNPDPGGQSQRTPDIWANRIVWRQEYDIRLCTLGVSLTSLEAGFIANTTIGQVPLVVAFTDETPGLPSGWYWDFGDGSNSTERNPVHTYVVPGDYTVTLTVHNAAQRDAAAYPSLITVQAPPEPAFTANQTCGPDPLIIQFTDLSSGYPVWWSWDFGDGGSSTDQNPVHTYPVAGTYSVTLTTGNAWGNSTITKSGFIQVLVGYYSVLQ